MFLQTDLPPKYSIEKENYAVSSGGGIRQQTPVFPFYFLFAPGIV